MPKEPQSRGRCNYCGGEFAKGSMARHLGACEARKAAVATAEAGVGKTERLYHLAVQSVDRPEYWLHLEMRGSATFTQLDSYLRHIWLECCGHMSEFTYEPWSDHKVAKSRKLDQVFVTNAAPVYHVYDFGTTSTTLIKPAIGRSGKATTKHPIALMARNLPPVFPCIVCGAPGQWLCMECVIEDEVWGALCDEHKESHEHEDYGEAQALLNSPRLGMCGEIEGDQPPY
ncbi:MAG: hypothetical protein V1772_11875 [Chloroflexota bacterium]